MLSKKEIRKYVQDPTPENDRSHFGVTEARQIGDALGIQWDRCDFDQFVLGVNVELEHGRRDPDTDVTHDRPLMTGKIAWAHLKEIPDYYTRLAIMENSAKHHKTSVDGGDKTDFSQKSMLLVALFVVVFIVTWVLETP